MDGLKAVNVYALETDHGLTLVDGGWAIEESRTLLESCLRDIGYGLSDITRFLVIHVHRDQSPDADFDRVVAVQPVVRVAPLARDRTRVRSPSQPRHR